MIAYLNGKLASKATNHVVIDVAGVGYRVGISTQTFTSLPPEDKELRLFIHHHFAESDQSLFGFLHMEEKSMFELLLTVKGVGPRLGLTILSGMSVEQLTDTILRQDVLKLSGTPGIGKKTAERMVLELKDKLGKSVFAKNGPDLSSPTGSTQNEVVSALEGLGYKKYAAQNAVVKAAGGFDREPDVSELLKAALKVLS